LATRGDSIILLTGPSERGWHRIETAITCLQLYAFKYERADKMDDGRVAASLRNKREEEASPALVKGSLFHLALAQHYRRMQARQEGDDEDNWCEPEEAVELVARAKDQLNYVDLVLNCYDVYKTTYWDDEELYRILAVEEARSTQVGPYRITGKLDLVWEDLNGRVQGVDTKTTGSITKRQRDYYTVSGQLIGYNRMLEEAYKNQMLAPFLINLVELSENAKCERLIRKPAPHMWRSYEAAIVRAEEEIEKYQKAGIRQDEWPKALSEQTCFRRYGECPYLEACRFGNVGAPKFGWQGDE
jgi:hypothetical protein